MIVRYLHIAALVAMLLGVIPAAAPVMADDQPSNQQGKAKKKKSPSTAAKEALAQNPGSTVLEIKDAGNKYIVTLKTPGELKRVAIPNSP